MYVCMASMNQIYASGILTFERNFKSGSEWIDQTRLIYILHTTGTYDNR